MKQNAIKYNLEFYFNGIAISEVVISIATENSPFFLSPCGNPFEYHLLMTSRTRTDFNCTSSRQLEARKPDTP